MWTDSTLETRQLAGIGPQIAAKLAAAGVTKLRQLAEIEPRRLEAIAQRHYPFGNEVHRALAECMPPAVTLQCLPVAWLPGGLVELEITVERLSGSTAPSPARLLVGSLHDDALLVCRQLALEQFPSPLVLRTRTRSAVGRGKAVEVVASVVHERLVGVDTAMRTAVPPGVELQGQRCQVAPKAAPATGPWQQQQQQQGSGGLPAARGLGAAKAALSPAPPAQAPAAPAPAADFEPVFSFL
ncbi:putative ATP-dependent DNA helicase HFM1 [Micractinium conductrix]|uniref:ATP-dependent DNA helicase HFM1 n=1 Tax=Micractinium conductrix TaxID=554055 RepID=A0A2P6VEV6_9CHLO|nr:putative ATP-dependent DNA helicase HFM1 [Micractinium conductrix]|eukprot:PSC72622.1 putative ATP-dependent DNA helicase HFM1 [Micractinium conductrix]